VPGRLRLCPDRVASSDPVDDVASPSCLFPGRDVSGRFAKALGGFRTTSLFTGDWDMWAKLAVRLGAAATNRVIGNRPQP